MILNKLPDSKYEINNKVMFNYCNSLYEGKIEEIVFIISNINIFVKYYIRFDINKVYQKSKKYLINEEKIIKVVK